MARHKIRNISGEDLVVPWLEGRVVAADEVVTVPVGDLASYLCQPLVWQAGDEEAESAYAQEVAAAEVQLDAEVKALIEALPEPWVPEPVVLGAEASVDAPAPKEPAQETEAPEATAAEEATAPADEPQESAAPAEEPAAPQGDEPREMTSAEVERDLPPRLRQLLDRTSAPATSTFTGSLPVQPRL